MRLTYLPPESELLETDCMFALAASDTDSSIEDFDGNFDSLEW